MHFEILVEDKSGRIALENIVETGISHFGFYPSIYKR